MAIDDELKAQILRYHFVEHWRVGTIASQLGVDQADGEAHRCLRRNETLLEGK